MRSFAVDDECSGKFTKCYDKLSTVLCKERLQDFSGNGILYFKRERAQCIIVGNHNGYQHQVQKSSKLLEIAILLWITREQICEKFVKNNILPNPLFFRTFLSQNRLKGISWFAV